MTGSLASVRCVCGLFLTNRIDDLPLSPRTPHSSLGIVVHYWTPLKPLQLLPNGKEAKFMLYRHVKR